MRPSDFSHSDLLDDNCGNIGTCLLVSANKIKTDMT